MDFDYVLPNGKNNSLLRTGVKGDRLLLVFYDPECPSCHDVMNQMIMDEDLRNAVADGKVTVLAVYTKVMWMFGKSHSVICRKVG